jgi:flagellar M-ring protein FliF
MAEGVTPRSGLIRPWQIGLLFGGLVAAMLVVHFGFIRVDFTTLQSGLRPAESATIVSELDRQGFDYRLASGGSEIQVEASKIDDVRVAIAGAGIQAGGVDGFELFNETEMGLTDFAQKIKYLRALQGELSRTIMMMEGVEDARVHIAIPERTLFRSERPATKAAVSLILSENFSASGAMVSGIQRLVASAVPDLEDRNVVVLDRAGAILNLVGVGPDGTERPVDTSPLAVSIRQIVARVAPGVQFEVFVTPKPPPARTDLNQETAPAIISTLIVSTTSPLDVQQQLAIVSGLQEARLLMPDNAAAVSFDVLAQSPSPPFDPLVGGVGGFERTPDATAGDGVGGTWASLAGVRRWFSFVGPSVLPWTGGLLSVLVALLVSLMLWRRRQKSTGLSQEDRQAQADELREVLEAYRRTVISNGPTSVQ